MAPVLYSVKNDHVSCLIHETTSSYFTNSGRLKLLEQVDCLLWCSSFPPECSCACVYVKLHAIHHLDRLPHGLTIDASSTLVEWCLRLPAIFRETVITLSELERSRSFCLIYMVDCRLANYVLFMRDEKATVNRRNPSHFTKTSYY
ncbi:hypothetical protein D918_08100 [Trichuris suis]|nr:hypothetical protein D918_08100 [Trichuris suis]